MLSILWYHIMSAYGHYRIQYTDPDRAFYTILPEYWGKLKGRPNTPLEDQMVEQYRGLDFITLAEFFALGFPFDYLERQWRLGLNRRFAGAQPTGWAAAPFHRVLFSAATGANESINEERVTSTAKKISPEAVIKAWGCYQNLADTDADKQFARLLDSKMFHAMGQSASGLSRVVALHLLVDWMWSNEMIKGKLTPAMTLMLCYSGFKRLEDLSPSIKRLLLSADMDI